VAFHESCSFIMMSDAEDETLELNGFQVTANGRTFCGGAQFGRTPSPAATAPAQSPGC
jgi:hypothetical protein